MADPHQVLTIIAAAIHDGEAECVPADSRLELNPEQSKHIAKTIVAALAEAGLQICPKPAE